MSKVKKFRSPNGKEIRIATTDGHVAIIGNELRDLPEFLWSHAYAAGATSEDIKSESMEDYIASKKREADEKAALERDEVKGILKSLFENPKDVVDSKGNLIHRKAITYIGKPVKKDELDSIWSEVTKESEV